MDNIQSISHTKNLTLNNINKSFGDNHVVKDLSLKVEKGEFVVLLGPSGCGKTTALRMIAGLESVDSGEIEIGDSVVTNKLPKFRNISMVFQSYALYPHKTVSENIAFPLKVRKISGDARDKAILDAAKQVHMEDLLDRYPRQLSGGQRQRVALARAIVRQPDIFLMDEPLSNLDAKLRVEMRREIKKLHQQLGTTIVYVTHDQTEAMSLGTSIAIMNHGIIQQCDSPKVIYQKPQNTFVADFIGSPSMNLLSGKIKINGSDTIFNIDGDTKISIPIKNYEFINKHINENQEVFFGIRPEHIYHQKNNENCVEFKLKPELNEYIGHEQITTFNFSGQELLVKFPSTIDIAINIADGAFAMMAIPTLISALWLAPKVMQASKIYFKLIDNN